MHLTACNRQHRTDSMIRADRLLAFQADLSHFGKYEFHASTGQPD
jgi:hypothetical protein